MACLSISFSEVEELEFITQQMRKKQSMEEEQLCYLPPRMEDGILKSAVRVSDGTIVRVDQDTTPVTTLGPTPHCEEGSTEHVQADVLAEGEGSVLVEREESLAPERIVSSDLGEAEGDQVEGSAVGKEDQELNIISEVPRTKLTEATNADPTLATAKAYIYMYIRIAFSIEL